MVTGPALDVRMSAKTTLERALDVADFEHWAEHQAAARAQGCRLGLGIATYIEAAPGPPGYMDAVVPGLSAFASAEPIHAVLEGDGSITVHTRQVPHGQGHETTLAQVAADELGVAVEAVRVRYGDTNFAPFGISGTGGSLSAAMAGGAVALAARNAARAHCRHRRGAVGGIADGHRHRRRSHSRRGRLQDFADLPRGR